MKTWSHVRALGPVRLEDVDSALQRRGHLAQVVGPAVRLDAVQHVRRQADAGQAAAPCDALEDRVGDQGEVGGALLERGNGDVRGVGGLAQRVGHLLADREDAGAARPFLSVEAAAVGPLLEEPLELLEVGWPRHAVEVGDEHRIRALGQLVQQARLFFGPKELRQAA